MTDCKKCAALEAELAEARREAKNAESLRRECFDFFRRTLGVEEDCWTSVVTALESCVRERDALRAEIERLKADLSLAQDEVRDEYHENDRLRKEIERKDAALRKVAEYADAAQQEGTDTKVYIDWIAERAVAALSSGEGEGKSREGEGGNAEDSGRSRSLPSPTLSREATRLEIHLLEETLGEVLASMQESIAAAERPKDAGYCDIRPYTVRKWYCHLSAILDAAQEVNPTPNEAS